jgi:hypothetical protein
LATDYAFELPHQVDRSLFVAGSYNILVGNGGNLLMGGEGRRNLLIAGASASTLVGGSDDDILIGGTTAYDTELASLQAILTYWTASDDYATRVGNLTSGTGVALLDATTVLGEIVRLPEKPTASSLWRAIAEVLPPVRKFRYFCTIANPQGSQRPCFGFRPATETCIYLPRATPQIGQPRTGKLSLY